MADEITMDKAMAAGSNAIGCVREMLGYISEIQAANTHLIDVATWKDEKIKTLRDEVDRLNRKQGGSMEDDRIKELQQENSDLRKLVQDKDRRIADWDSAHGGLSRMLEHKDELIVIAERKVASLTGDLTFLADHATRETWNSEAWRCYTGTTQELVGEIREWVDRKERAKAAAPLIEHPESDGLPGEEG